MMTESQTRSGGAAVLPAQGRSARARGRRFFLVGVLAMALARPALALSPTPEEMTLLGRWVAAKFEPPPAAPKVEPGLLVLANHDPVLRNARGPAPMHIADKEYTRGLYCHAVSKVVVRLPGPGKTFTAVVGIDSNDDTRGGKGSVVFSVTVGGKEALKSGVLHEGMAGVPVSVDLGGATEFVLDIGDAGDGISCDQSDWADAKVELADGKTLWLGNLPLLESPGAMFDAEPPFSFTYGGKPSGELLKTWDLQRSSRRLDDQRTERTLVWTDPRTGLAVRCAAVEYHDFPTVEWTLYFKNTGAADTPILEDIQAIDVRLERTGGGEFVLYHSTGSPCTAGDFQPHETPLGPKAAARITTSGGRPTNSDMPYFNVAWPGAGAIVVLGWPGQWAARFTRDEAKALRVQGGQELTRFKLLPGEEVRTPLALLQFWTGDRIRSQNVWRRWMLAHGMPRPGGNLPPPQMAACSSHQFGEMIHANTENQKLFVDRYLQEGLRLDYWWMDAGWYWNKTGWPNTGTWEVDTDRFPGGLRVISDHAHSKGVKIIVWFEPERVTAGTWLADQHPEWVLGGKDGGLLALGDPEARRWLTDHVDKLLTEQGIDLYRQDFNMDPLGHWRGNDAPDRQGITEIRHVEGYLAYWDELRRRHPNMLIDTCASGGRRLDLETLRRAVPLLRSDYIMEPVGNQCHTYGLAFWSPFQGTGGGSGEINAYLLRSILCLGFNACFDVRRKDLDYDLIRRLVGEWRRFAPCFYGDYYPLTPYSLAQDVWMAWQFDRPDLGEGMIQVFRRAESPYESARFRLGGLENDARYTLTNLDVEGTTEMTGRDLIEKGLLVSVTERPAAVIITYKRAK